MDIVFLTWCCAKLTPGGDCVEMGSGLLIVLEELGISQTGHLKDKICLFFPGKLLLPLVMNAYRQGYTKMTEFGDRLSNAGI